MGYTNIYDLVGGINAYKESHVSVDLTPASQDLGTVIYGDVASTEFTLTNFTSTLLTITRLSTSCGCTQAQIAKNTLEPYVDVYLYPSILKKENLELVAQKATEVGVKVIIPVISARTVKLNVRSERMVKIVREAAEQSGRAQVPMFHEPIELSEAFKHAKGNDLNIFFDPGGELFDVRTTIPRSARRIGIFIGPEGGWESGEIELARQHGCVITSLGKLILRAETAAVVAAYLAAQGQS